MFQLSSFNRILMLFLLFIGALIIARIFYTGSLRYLFLIWNLFLAWLPYVLSYLFEKIKIASRNKFYVLFFTWLLLFPNSLYIITDLIHLQADTSMPVWYDAVILFASSFVGLIMGFTSMQRVENFAAKIYSKKIVSLFVSAVLCLASFGVFLGRFERWNSWDIINNPLALLSDVFSILLLPHQNIRTWLIVGILSAMYCLLYFFIKHLKNSLADERTAHDRNPYANKI